MLIDYVYTDEKAVGVSYQLARTGRRSETEFDVLEQSNVSGIRRQLIAVWQRLNE